MRFRLFCSTSLDVYLNQSYEKELFDTADEGELTLYIWRNDHTIVIGRHQDAKSECRLSLFEEEGGKLARRISGGGAVYHDKGNLNFTFIAKEPVYDLKQNQELIMGAVRSFNIECELSGRNDILSDGRKFSGNAFYKEGNTRLHHGTLLICTDPEKISRYLTPPLMKLKKRGIASVGSRVVNLSELNGAVTAASMQKALTEAFKCLCKDKGGEFYEMKQSDFDAAEIEKKRANFYSREYLLGEDISFDKRAELLFDSGLFDVRAKTEGGIIKEVKIFSDCLDIDYIKSLENYLLGKSVYSKTDGEGDASKILEALNG